MANTPSTLCSSISAGFVIPACAFGAGGASDVWFSSSTGMTFTFDVDNQITNISGGTFYRFQQVQETLSVTENCKTNIQNTSQYWEQDIEAVVPKKSVAIRNQIRALAASGTYIIVLDNNGLYRLYGYQNKCYLTEGANNTGKALGDANNYVLKFKGTEGQESFIINASTSFTSSY